jgi:hypothetical protein
MKPGNDLGRAGASPILVSRLSWYHISFLGRVHWEVIMPDTVQLFVFNTLADWEPGFAVAGINDSDGQKAPAVTRFARSLLHVMQSQP